MGVSDFKIFMFDKFLDKKAESWSSFSRYSLSPNKSFILFVRVYFTAIHVL